MKELKFRVYAHTERDLTFEKAWKIKEDKFNPIEPPKNGQIWDDWYEDSQSYMDELLSSMEREYLEEKKMIEVGIGIDGKIIHSAKDHVKKLLSGAMGYIGRVDKNDKGIYCGDIVKIRFYNYSEVVKEIVREVAYSQNRLNVLFMDRKSMKYHSLDDIVEQLEETGIGLTYDMEILGNIYENKIEDFQ